MRLSRALPMILAAGCLMVAGCSDPTSSDGDYTELVLTHDGYDFSAGRADTATWANNDGDLTLWQPTGANNPQYARDRYVWWRNDQTTSDQTNATKDMGEVNIGGVKGVPATWDVSPNIPPLLVGHVVVAKCNDGFVKFEVLSTDTAAWQATVRYLFTTAGSF
jgi:hypothetical protein